MTRRKMFPGADYPGTAGNRVGLPDDFPKDVNVSRRGVLPAPYSPLVHQASDQSDVSLTPWWQERPPFATDFTAIDKATVVAAVAGTVVSLPGTQFRLPTGDFLAVVKAVTIFVNAPGLTLDVDFQVRVNNGPVPGWDRLSSFPRVAANLSIDFGGTIFVPQGALIEMVAINNAATGPWTVGGQLTGWYLSKADIDRVFGRSGY